MRGSFLRCIAVAAFSIGLVQACSVTVESNEASREAMAAGEYDGQGLSLTLAANDRELDGYRLRIAVGQISPNFDCQVNHGVADVHEGINEATEYVVDVEGEYREGTIGPFALASGPHTVILEYLRADNVAYRGVSFFNVQRNQISSVNIELEPVAECHGGVIFHPDFGSRDPGDPPGTGKSMQQCNEEGKAWIAVVDDGNSPPTCGGPLASWGCCQSQIMARFPAFQEALGPLFDRMVADNFQLYNCEAASETSSRFHLVSYTAEGRMEYRQISIYAHEVEPSGELEDCPQVPRIISGSEKEVDENDEGEDEDESA